MLNGYLRGSGGRVRAALAVILTSLFALAAFAPALAEPSEDEDVRFIFAEDTAPGGAPFTFESVPLDHEVIDPPLYAATFRRERMIQPDGGKRVALTFDDGPSSYTAGILDTLERYGAKATFCVIGSRVSNYASAIERADSLGCEIIGHSWSHNDLTWLSVADAAEDIRRTARAIARVTGKTPLLFRPPYGSVSEGVRAAARQNGSSMIMWSVDTLDWSSRNADKVYNQIISGAKDGAIILCHDIYSSTAEAVRRAVPELIRRGFSLVTVSELLGFDREAPSPGKSYHNK
jgi:peptidoglycan/xylan/chitin deacetylase (PgdA/CDA1 family)